MAALDLRIALPLSVCTSWVAFIRYARAAPVGDSAPSDPRKAIDDGVDDVEVRIPDAKRDPSNATGKSVRHTICMHA